jgi:soluble lytic murein transglycosylase-like protein
MLVLGSRVANAACWEEASAAQDIPVAVLKAVAETESSFNAAAMHRNADGTIDIGMMQINSSWLPALAQHGIQRAHLWDGCTNIKVGAWILAQNANRLGWNWDAVGAYNVGCRKLAKAQCDARRAAYARKIHKALLASPDTRHAGHETSQVNPAGAAVGRLVQVVWLTDRQGRPERNDFRSTMGLAND